MRTVAFLLAASVAVGNTAPTFPSFVAHEERVSLARDIRRVGRVDSDVLLPVRIALTQSNLAHAYNHVMDVSHPSSERYGRHWTAEEVDKTFAPSEASVQAVREWLHSTGIAAKDIASRKGWLAIDIRAGQAEELFKTEYFEHETADGTIRIGCDKYEPYKSFYAAPTQI